MTEQQILAGNFVFISYSHRDADAVKEDVKALQERGVRVWFDANMRLSESWMDQAHKVMTHPNCRGVIFYHSKYSYVSNACSIEREKAWEQHQKDEGYGFWFVNLEGKSIDTIDDEAMDYAREELNDRSLYKNASRGKLLSEFNSNYLCIFRTDSASCVETIYQKIARDKGLVDDVGSVTSSLENMGVMSKDTKGMKFGVYLNEKYTAPLNREGKGERFQAEDGTEYIVRDEQIYTVQPLYWKLLYVENDVSVFLCDEIIDYCKGGAFASEFLESKFYPVAFSEEEKAKLSGRMPRLLTKADLEKNQTPSAIALHHQPDSLPRHWWVDMDGLMKDWKMTYCNDVPYPKGFVISIEKGVRPVIEIPTKNLQ